jgi:hypothetical protein
MTLLPLVEELRDGYKNGHPIRDHSLPPDAPASYYYLHSVLLHFIGDYPGQGKVPAMQYLTNNIEYTLKHFLSS